MIRPAHAPLSSPAASDPLRPAGPREVAPRHTRLDLPEARSTLAAAWRQKFGREPNDRTLAVLTSQWAMETGRGSAMMNFNFGGIKGTGPSGLTTAYRTFEGHDATRVEIKDHFRAYLSAQEGARDYLDVLQRRFPAALERAAEGDARGFVHELKTHGYFTGSETEYTKAIGSISRELLGEAADDGRGLRGHVATAVRALAAPFRALGVFDSLDGDDVVREASSVVDFHDRIGEASLRVAEMERNVLLQRRDGGHT